MPPESVLSLPTSGSSPWPVDQVSRTVANGLGWLTGCFGNQLRVAIVARHVGDAEKETRDDFDGEAADLGT